MSASRTTSSNENHGVASQSNRLVHAQMAASRAGCDLGFAGINRFISDRVSSPRRALKPNFHFARALASSKRATLCSQ